MYQIVDIGGVLYLAKKYPQGNVGIVAMFQGTAEQVRIPAQEIVDILNSWSTRVTAVKQDHYPFNPTGELQS